MTGASLEDVALAIAAELRPLDARTALARIGLLASELDDAAALAPAERAERLIALLSDGPDSPSSSTATPRR